MVPYTWICMATMLGNSKNYSPKLCPAIPKAINLMALNRKDHCFSRDSQSTIPLDYYSSGL